MHTLRRKKMKTRDIILMILVVSIPVIVELFIKLVDNVKIFYNILSCK